MNRRRIIHLQLAALAVLTVLLLGRVFSGPRVPDGLVVLSDLEPHRLAHQAFVLDDRATLAVEATGSFEQARGGAPSLAAYGWIVRRDDGEVVWQMEPSAARAARGTLVRVLDTLSLEAGRYDVYFAAYGNAFYSRRDRSLLRRVIDPEQHWQNDERAWMMAVRTLPASRERARVLPEDAGEQAPPRDGLLWTSAPMRDGQRADYLFEVQRPVRVRVYAVGEFDGRPMDYGWIEEVVTGRRYWEMTEQNTEPAGGAPENRRFQGVLALGPGVYRAVFVTDRGHAFSSWRANPPFDPHGWGLTLAADAEADRAFLRPFDPWATRQPLISITRIPDGELRSAQFQLSEKLRALLYGVGEISGGGQFDYAWLKNDDTEARLWEMTREASQPAGGHENNRVEMAFLELDPGTYTLYYQTDGSHAYGNWSNGEPDHPERWGVTLFALEASFDPAAVHLLREARVEDASEAEAGAPAVPPVPPVPALSPLGSGETLVEATRLGNEAHVEVPFTLAERTTLRIYALGEITLRGRYDYGWIERQGTGERMWEMTWQNTHPAGDDDRNRRFDGTLTLEPGPYVAYFQTDLSHAYGDFGDYTPDDPEGWGFVIERVE